MGVGSKMYFYIDESGNSGNNLFDKQQPFLYYATLAAPLNLQREQTLKELITVLRNDFQVDRLHANELGITKLDSISGKLKQIIFDYNLIINFYFLEKKHYILCQFFDQIFDSEVNKAVPYDWYWTYRRDILLLELNELFIQLESKGENFLQKFWEAFIEKDVDKLNRVVVLICKKLINIVNNVRDKVIRKIIKDALSWVIKNTDIIYFFNASSNNQVKQISPNIVGFQFVLTGISEILQKKNTKASSIIVDIQSEFNRAQSELMDFYQNISKMEIPSEIENNKLHVAYKTQEKFSQIPSINLNFVSGYNNIGLELVDLYLWIFKRYFEGKKLSDNLTELCKFMIGKSDASCAGISLDMTKVRQNEFLNSLNKPA